MDGVAVVTGGSRGIGAATAVLLARRGWTLCIGYRAAAASADRVVEECEAAGVVAAAVAADLTSSEGAAALFAAADRLGPVRALVNNAGVVAARSRVDEMTLPRLERMFRINAIAPLLCAREAVRRMSTRHGGEG